MHLLSTARHAESLRPRPAGGLISTQARDAEPRRLPSVWEPLLTDGVRPLLIAGDLLAGALAMPAAHGYLVSEVAFADLLVLLFSGGGLYRSRLELSVLDDVPRILRRWLMAVAILLVSWLVLDVNPTLGQAFAMGIAVVGIRAALYALVRTLRRSGAVAHPTIVIGAGDAGREVANQLKRHPECGLRPVGFLDRGSRDADGLVLPLFGGPAELNEVLEEHQPHALVLARGAMRDDEMVALVRACQRHRCEVFVLPRLHEITQVGEDMDFLGDLPLIRLRRAVYRSPSWQLKRLLDVVFSVLAIIALAPVLVCCSVAVLIEGGRGVIFRQERVGCDGRRFQLLKFRSLRPVNEGESKTRWNISTDGRLGKVGRILRVASLDELPQLFNILRGDMSLVGPRPERPYFVEEFARLYPGYAARHRVPSGLTGWAQIHGLRGDTSIDERARLDNFYIENWSLWLDIKILLRTLISIFKSPGS
jgi:exopolysaccharide biosynthesis polyprenyl glycosylphosphotransferase